MIEDIIENSGTPYFSFKDLDENKPTGSIKIRVETIDYFLKRYREDLLKKADAARELERRLADYERSLRMGAAAVRDAGANVPLVAYPGDGWHPGSAAGDD